MQHLKACAVRRQKAAASRVHCPSPSLQKQFDPSRGISSPMVNGSKEVIVDIRLFDCDQAAGSGEQRRQGHITAMHKPPTEKALDDEDGVNEGEDVGEGEEECMPSASSICLNSICTGGNHDSEGDSEGSEDAEIEIAHSAYNGSSYAEPRARASKAVREVDSSTLSRDSNLSESGGYEATCLQEGEINAFMSMSMSCSPTAGDAVEQNRGSDHRSAMRVDLSWGTGTGVDNCHERLYQQGMKRNSKRGQDSEVTTCSIN